MATELHVQAAVWDHRGTQFAALFLEGEAPDRLYGGVARDALFRVLLARGLRLTTDLDHVPMVTAPGWHAHLDQAGAVTLEWPHHQPLLAGVPLSLPDGWARSATENGSVVVFAGHGIGLHDGTSPVSRLHDTAANGALATGAAPFTTDDGVTAD